MKEYNIVITGVGGQGILTAANLLGWAALRAGYKVRVGEVHGMSQRFGSVIAYVRFGEDVYGAMVPEGKADVILSFEPVEALRYINYLKKGGLVFTNARPIPPVQVSMGLATYPTLDEMKKIVEEDFGGKFMAFDAEKLAMEAGNIVTTNVVLIGALSQTPGFPLSEEQIKEVIRISVPPKTIDVNMRAFELGVKAAKEMLGL
ncbi:indolepyruvate: ferredoxin oxidoreductase, beta subunit [Thermococcus kodakarensis KOD1]|uniref:Indolepyruvate oxidoreductase subunit IorB n=1 Tax=Thermococcus kodakarensis (strain ATCC BAA-918 / JCM 12380 / KOD1) TaxID=69014 RepID=IORB_THEKO|nr:indolepyruvate oxidoreductase subunit beta [Thermococcus kodakarensis]O07836.2 RecName: Full=Indolepyruvate oxidoreductase subunit IorB; Short=IOR; AltName: Full=Indolepyruvate ferredoxin oxidoreductase subunit beta [Thermococcus kodakarensis KOD1]WCN28243.1 indolepyruvate oxidoreductase subunit beta [Thermococcus kodakarensis]WCN30538.1 indolepyruvate oxidoreductase subunit beta [Thermococcus kodakarensis]BAD84324.1 indolepyruvate: ferredoxin oxidoreductase, beta subunit [Thermococcus kodak